MSETATADMHAEVRASIIRQDIAFQIAVWNEHFAPTQIQQLPRSLVAIAKRIASLRAEKLAAERAREETERALTKAVAEATPGAGKVRAILAAVSATHGVTVDQIIGTGKTIPVAIARQDAMWRLKNETKMSLPQIGLALGGRDHTTILHGIRKHEERMRGGAR